MTPKLISSLEVFDKKICTGTKHLMDHLVEVEIHITDACNLNCARCGHFSPLAKPGFPDKEEIVRDLTRLSEITKDHPIESLGILGGEPLLNPDLPFYINKSLELFPNTIITIITNGILIDKMKDDFWKAANQQRVVIVISKYFEESFYHALDKVFEEHNTKNYVYIENSYGCVLFANLGLCKDGNGLTGEEVFEGCPSANKHLQLRHGRLYSCANAAYLDILENHFHEGFKDVIKTDGIDIYQHNLEEIINFLNKPKECCVYCNPNCFKKLYFPEHSKKEKSEWIMEDKHE